MRFFFVEGFFPPVHRAFVLADDPRRRPTTSTISRTRRLLSLEAHQAVFTWVLQQLAGAGLLPGKTVGIDATTLEANAALRSIRSSATRARTTRRS